MNRRSRIALVAFSVFWVAAVCLGAAVMLRYSFAPGGSGTAPPKWPTTSVIPRNPRLPTLLVFAHPRCPCTRATVGELAQIMADCKDLVEAHVVFVPLDGLSEKWDKNSLWNSAGAVPGVSVMVDADAQEARRFGAMTSGHTLLYGKEGDLQFAGGITESRGHAGANLGRAAVTSLIRSGRTEACETPVFGCLLFAAAKPDISCCGTETTCPQ